MGMDHVSIHSQLLGWEMHIILFQAIKDRRVSIHSQLLGWEMHILSAERAKAAAVSIHSQLLGWEMPPDVWVKSPHIWMFQSTPSF